MIPPSILIDLERADDDPDAQARLIGLDPAVARAVAEEQRMHLLLTVALRPPGATTAVRQALMAIDAASTAQRRRALRPWRRPTHRSWPLLVAAALLLLVVGGWWSRDQTLAIGDHWQGSGHAHLADGSRLDLDQGSLMVEADGALRLHRGTVTVAAKPQPLSAPLSIRTEAATIAVIGTRFRLTSDGDTWVSVDEGVVEVTTATDRILVHHGQAATARRDAWPTLVPMDLAREVTVLRSFAPANGRPPRHWHARVLPCPPGRVGDALHGVNFSAHMLFGVAYDNWDHLEDTIRVAKGMRLQGWLWCDGPLEDLALRSGDSDRDLDFALPLTVPLRTWIRLDIPLALLADDAGRHPEPGRRIADLRFQARQASAQILVLDQAQLTVPKEIVP